MEHPARGGSIINLPSPPCFMRAEPQDTLLLKLIENTYISAFGTRLGIVYCSISLMLHWTCIDLSVSLDTNSSFKFMCWQFPVTVGNPVKVRSLRIFIFHHFMSSPATHEESSIIHKYIYIQEAMQICA